MNSFQHVAPALRVFAGADSLAHLGRELLRLKSERAVVVCGDWMQMEGSLLAAVRTGMDGRCAGVFSAVVAHSPVAAVEAAAKELARLEADAVVAIGGGSAIVTARAASILLAEKGDPRALATSRDETGALRSPKLIAPKLPQLVVATTPTTAIVKAGSALFDPATGDRLALFDPKTRAGAVFVHPDLVATAPRALVVAASINTLSMAIEGLVSKKRDLLADGHLMHALRLCARHLASAHLDAPDTRAELVLAAVLCGQGTDHTGAGITTVLGHAVGARHEVDNGLVNAVVLPAVLRFNGAAPGLANVADALGLGLTDDVERIATSVAALFAAVGAPSRLRDLGVAREGLGAIAEAAFGDWFLGGNPRAVRDVGELRGILEDTW